MGIWLIAAVVVASLLVGVLLTITVSQWVKIARLEGRVQSFGQQLRNVPKRKTDRVVD
jgi:hypothetical protein